MIQVKSNGLFEIIEEMSQITDTIWVGGHPRTIHNVPEILEPFKYVFCFDGRPSYYAGAGQMVTACAFDDRAYLPDEGMLHHLADMVLAASQKGKTLVHCAGGINRSVLITTLALIKGGMKPLDAIALIRAKRSHHCLSNKVFYDWVVKQV
jgi:hypothetical protein